MRFLLFGAILGVLTATVFAAEKAAVIPLSVLAEKSAAPTVAAAGQGAGKIAKPVISKAEKIKLVIGIFPGLESSEFIPSGESKNLELVRTFKGYIKRKFPFLLAKEISLPQPQKRNRVLWTSSETSTLGWEPNKSKVITMAKGQKLDFAVMYNSTSDVEEVCGLEVVMGSYDVFLIGIKDSTISTSSENWEGGNEEDGRKKMADDVLKMIGKVAQIGVTLK